MGYKKKYPKLFSAVSKVVDQDAATEVFIRAADWYDWWFDHEGLTLKELEQDNTALAAAIRQKIHADLERDPDWLEDEDDIVQAVYEEVVRWKEWYPAWKKSSDDSFAADELAARREIYNSDPDRAADGFTIGRL